MLTSGRVTCVRMLERFGGIGASSLLACPAGAIVVRRGPLPCKFLRMEFLVEIEGALPADLAGLREKLEGETLEFAFLDRALLDQPIMYRVPTLDELGL